MRSKILMLFTREVRSKILMSFTIVSMISCGALTFVFAHVAIDGEYLVVERFRAIAIGEAALAFVFALLGIFVMTQIRIRSRKQVKPHAKG